MGEANEDKSWYFNLKAKHKALLYVILLFVAIPTLVGMNFFIPSKNFNTLYAYIVLMFFIGAFYFIYLKKTKYSFLKKFKTYQLVLYSITIGAFAPLGLMFGLFYTLTIVSGKQYESQIYYYTKEEFTKVTCQHFKFQTDIKGWTYNSVPFEELPKGFCLTNEEYTNLPEKGGFILTGKETFWGRSIDRVIIPNSIKMQEIKDNISKIESDWSCCFNF